MAENKTALDMALEKLETSFHAIEGDRSSIIAKMKQCVDSIILNPNEDSPRITEVKLATIKTFDDLLKSAESSAVTMAKTQMQRKDSESSEASKQLVIEMLKNINNQIGSNSGRGNGVVIPAELNAAVNKAVIDSGHPIEETELAVNDVPLKEITD